MSLSDQLDVHDRAVDLVMSLGTLLEAASELNELTASRNRGQLADVCDQLERQAVAVADRARALPLSFQELPQLGQQARQVLCQQFTAQQLALALRGEPLRVSACVLAALPEADAAELQAVIDATGPQRRGDIRSMQQQIVDRTLALHRTGALSLTVTEAADA